MDFKKQKGHWLAYFTNFQYNNQQLLHWKQLQLLVQCRPQIEDMYVLKGQPNGLGALSLEELI